MSNAFDLSSLTREEQPQAEPDSNQRESLDTTTAFVVALSTDGTWAVLHDLTQPLTRERTATADDIYSAAAVIQKDILAQESAAHTQRLMLQLGAAMQQRAQTDSIAARLGNLRP